MTDQIAAPSERKVFEASESEWTGEASRSRRTRQVAFEFVLIATAFLVYFGVRGLTEGNYEVAAANAQHVIRLEQALHLDIEHGVQSLVTGSSALTNMVNWIYIWGHWPVIAAVATWLVLAHPAQYRLIRNAFLISGGVGLIVFALFPVAPPRLIDMNLIDTVTEKSKAYRVLQPHAFVNQYAAVPSLHFGWDLLIGIALYRFGTRAWMRVLGIVLPFAMAFAIVATANHFLLDGILGGGLALISLAAAMALQNHSHHHPPEPGASTRREHHYHLPFHRHHHGTPL